MLPENVKNLILENDNIQSLSFCMQSRVLEAVDYALEVSEYELSIQSVPNDESVHRQTATELSTDYAADYADSTWN